MHRRFPILVEDPGETHAFRTRFHQAAALCLLYRLLGTLAATAGFAGYGTILTAESDMVYLLTGAYCFYSAVLLYRVGWLELSVRSRRLRLGSGSYDWLDRPAFIYGDLAVAVALNLLATGLLRPGTAYSAYSDIFRVALVSSIALWSGRRGGRAGVLGVGLAVVVQVAQGLLNGIPLADVDWRVISFRTFWVICGVVIAVGVVRILLDYAERTERLRLEDEMLVMLSRSHNDYKEALRVIAGILASNDDNKHDTAIHLAHAALAAGDRRVHQGADTMDALVGEVIERVRATAPTTFEFLPVDGTHSSVRLLEPKVFTDILVNLCSNAARHSQGTRVTIRWGLDGDELVVTVRDDGIGMPPTVPKRGLALTERLLERLGAELNNESVSQGTKLVLRLPPQAFRA